MQEVLYEENCPVFLCGLDIVSLLGFGCVEHHVSLVYADGFVFGDEDGLRHTQRYADHHADASHTDFYRNTDIDGLRFYSNSIRNGIPHSRTYHHRAHRYDSG